MSNTRKQIAAQLGMAAHPGAKAKMAASISKHGHKVRAGIMDRIGAAASALTASPADPTSPQYRQQLAAAKKTAQDAVGNYKFMRDKVKGRQDAMDKYVGSAIKTINASTNVQDVEHFAEQIQIAVRALSTMLSSVKTPFARPGAKAKMSVVADERQIGLWMDQVQKNLTRAVNEARALPSGSDEKYAYRYLVQALKMIMRGLDSGDHRMVRNGLYDLKMQAMADMGDDWRNWVPREVDEWVAGGGQMKSARPGASVAFDLWTQIQRDMIEKKAPPPNARAWSAAVTKEIALARDLAANSSSLGTHKALYRQQAEALSLLKTAVVRGDKKYARGIIKNLPTEITKDLPADLIAWANSKGTASRPGAKAKMDKSAALAIVGKAIADVPAGAQRDALQKALIDYYDNTQASNRLLKQGNTTDANRFAVEAGRAAQIAVRTWDRMGKPAAELRGFTQNLERAAEFARPGAKATAAKPSDLEREDVKAGLKLMAASDEAVSNKIRTLLAEGKPQDQAVAIALDMKRRGEL